MLKGSQKEAAHFGGLPLPSPSVHSAQLGVIWNNRKRLTERIACSGVLEKGRGGSEARAKDSKTPPPAEKTRPWTAARVLSWPSLGSGTSRLSWEESFRLTLRAFARKFFNLGISQNTAYKLSSGQVGKYKVWPSFGQSSETSPASAGLFQLLPHVQKFIDVWQLSQPSRCKKPSANFLPGVGSIRLPQGHCT